MSKKQFIILGAALLLLLAAAGAGYYFTRGKPADMAAAASGELPPDSVTATDHVMGSADAPVTIIEYFAQACSVCAAFDAQVFPQLKAKYIDTGKVRYVMRLFPLFPIDAPSHKLALCMPREYFFQATDLLFRSQPQWDSAEFQGVDAHAGLLQMARVMGMDAAKAEACMTSTEHDTAINKVAEEGNARYQIEGTPTFVIDFKKYDGGKSWDAIQVAIDAALAAKGK